LRFDERFEIGIVIMRQGFFSFGFAASLSALALLASCGPKASEQAATPPTETAPAEATTNGVAPTPVPSPATSPATGPATPAAASVALAIKDAAGADLSGDPSKGAAAFSQCKSCHTREAGVNRVGPSLAGIVGSHASKVPGFRYSPANVASNITWTEQELYDYLENPRAKIPGTTMAFVGIKDSQKRADLIAYLKSPS
jgi:cytochrome c